MASSVKKNFAYQMIYEVLVLILPFITSPYIARVIGAEGVGIFAYSYSIAYYFVLFSMLGLKNHGNRAIARCREDKELMDKTFSALLFLHILVSVVCFAVYIGYVLVIRKERVYAAIQAFFVLSALFDISWFYFGIEKFKATVTRNVIIRLINVACVFIFVRKEGDLWKYCLIMALGNLISQLVLWLPLRKYVRIVKPDMALVKAHLKPLLILFIPAIAVSLYKYMDKIMIGAMANKEQLGFYENAEKVINIPLTIIGSFGTVMLPKMSNLASKADKSTAKYYMGVSMKYVMWLALALTCGLCGVGTVFAPIFWGKGFVASGYLIMALSTTIPFLAFANIIRTQFLIPNQMDKEYIASVICGAVVNLIINALLIPDMGAKGATIGTVAAEVMVCLVQCYAVRKQLPLLSYLKSFMFFVLAGGLMLGAVFSIGKLMGTSMITLLVQIAAGVGIYGIISVVYLHATKDQVFEKMFRQIMKKLHLAK